MMGLRRSRHESSSSTGTATNSNPPDRQCNSRREKQKEGKERRKERVKEERKRKGSRRSRARAGQEGRDGLDRGDEKQEAEEEDVSGFRQDARVQNVPLHVSLDDTTSDVLRQIQNDEDVYVTMHGRVLKRREKLRSCGVTDGCTMQITSRLRGGGRHKDKRNKAEKNRGRGENGQEDQQVEPVGGGCQK